MAATYCTVPIEGAVSCFLQEIIITVNDKSLKNKIIPCIAFFMIKVFNF